MVASRSSKSGFAYALSGNVVADAGLRTADVAVTMFTSGIVEVASLALVASATAIFALACTVAAVLVAHLRYRSNSIALAVFTFIRIKAIRTYFARVPGVVVFAGAQSSDWCTIVSFSAVQVASTRLAVWVVEVPVCACVTIWWQKFLPTFALASLFGAIARRIVQVTIAGLAHIDFVPSSSVWPVEGRPAFVTVDALCVVLAVLADAATFVSAVDVQRQPLLVHLRVVHALGGVVVAVAWFTLESVPVLRDPPLLLFEAGAALGALRAAGVVLTPAYEDVALACRVRRVACVRVTVAHAPPTNTDVFDTVEVPPGNSRVLSGHRHKMSQHVFSPQQSKSYVGCSRPLL